MKTQLSNKGKEPAKKSALQESRHLTAPTGTGLTIQSGAVSLLSRQGLIQLAQIAGNQGARRILTDETGQGFFENKPQRLKPEQETGNDMQLKTAATEAQRLVDKEAMVESKENRTGIPDKLKSATECLSGIDLSEVRVNYNSAKPLQLNALAYSRGAEIHIAPGQEEHLAHEVWHTVQQKQGRVKPVTQMKGMPVNDEPGLEHEADMMGQKATGQIIDPIQNRFKERTNMVQSFHPVIQNCLQLKTIYYEKLEPVKPEKDKDVDVTPVEQKQKLTAEPLPSKKPGYIGGAIVWVKEKNIDDLALNYCEKSQSWKPSERKSRLGVVFGINDRLTLDQKCNAKSEEDLKLKTTTVFDKVKDKLSVHIESFTWEHKWRKKDNDEERYSTKELCAALNSTGEGADVWKKDNEEIAKPKDAQEHLEKEYKKSKEADLMGNPYGMLRNKVSSSTGLKAVEESLKKNLADPVYFHSLDADAPSFETVMPVPEKEGEYLSVLDVYDEILAEKEQKPTVVIGGYNLIEDITKETDLHSWFHTARSNLIDLVIREAAYKYSPLLVYPTEPNFLVNMEMLKKLHKEQKAKSIWGVNSSEGWALFENIVKQIESDKKITKGDRKKHEVVKDKLQGDILYDFGASVPTGTGGGGARLKVVKGKKYDANSIMGKPVTSKLSKDDTIPIPEQYLVQGQSWSGASRIGRAYHRALILLGGQIGAKEVIPLFAPVEKMVMSILSGKDPVFDETEITSEKNYTTKKDTYDKIEITGLIKAIQIALLGLKNSKEWQELNLVAQKRGLFD